MANFGTIIFVGDYGSPEAHLAKISVRGVTDDAALGTLATDLSGWSLCNLRARSISTYTDLGGDAPAEDANVDQKAVVYMRDQSDNSIVRVSIPAPDPTNIESTGAGDRLSAAAVSAIATSMGTATGKTFTGLYGKIIQKG